MSMKCRISRDAKKKSCRSFEETTLDEDEWQQYCVRFPIEKPRQMGHEKVFIELIFDWDEWCPRVEKNSLTKKQKEENEKEELSKSQADEEVGDIWGNANPQG